jgi:putative endonuclease
MDDLSGNHRKTDLSKRMKGEIAERIAGAFLRKQGYTILETNFHFGRGEIDIIARDRNVLVFVEVKSKQSDQDGRPEDEVDKRKQSQVRRIAEGYLHVHDIRDVACRCDVVAIVGDEKSHILRYYKDAF